MRFLCPNCNAQTKTFCGRNPQYDIGLKDYKYRYKSENNSDVHLFANTIGKEKHCINFPYMTSIISILKNENKTIKISIISMFISLCSFIVSIMK